MTASRFVTRFAPSPSGHLHRGHAFSALSARVAADEAGGDFLLRIEDIDDGRCAFSFEEAIYVDLAWLGISWRGRARRQSEHLADYRAALARLEARGLVYRCFKTRAEVLADIGRAPHEPIPAYVGAPLAAGEERRRLAQGRPFAWRLSLEAARRELGGFDRLAWVEEGAGSFPACPERTGDVVLARKDLGVSYHLAVVVDDALQGISHVIRGEDLREACHVQRLLQALLDLPSPIYRHHRLLLRADGKRFAKRDTAETLRDLRERGVGAEVLRAELGFGGPHFSASRASMTAAASLPDQSAPPTRRARSRPRRS
ncbi:MAG: tRNA glutamyl-Q(34) synthetase GluQRS [Caulobacteraceae bacterium]